MQGMLHIVMKAHGRAYLLLLGPLDELLQLRVATVHLVRGQFKPVVVRLEFFQIREAFVSLCELQLHGYGGEQLVQLLDELFYVAVVPG